MKRRERGGNVGIAFDDHIRNPVRFLGGDWGSRMKGKILTYPSYVLLLRHATNEKSGDFGVRTSGHERILDHVEFRFGRVFAVERIFRLFVDQNAQRRVVATVFRREIEKRVNTRAGMLPAEVRSGILATLKRGTHAREGESDERVDETKRESRSRCALVGFLRARRRNGQALDRKAHFVEQARFRKVAPLDDRDIVHNEATMSNQCPMARSKSSAVRTRKVSPSSGEPSRYSVTSAAFAPKSSS